MRPDAPAAGRSSLFLLSRMEWLIGSRTAAWRLLFLCSFIYGCGIGRSAEGSGAGAAAYATGQAGWQVIGIVAIVWMSLLAIRDSATRTRVMVFSKPQPCETLAIAKYAGGLAQLLALLLALFIGSALFRLIAGAEFSELSVYPLQFVRALGVVFFASAASYMLALLSDSAIAGMLVGLYLALTMAGKSFLSRYSDPAPIQNVGAYVTLGGVMLCLAFGGYARRRRGSARPSAWISLAASLLIVATVWQFDRIIANGYDMSTHRIPPMDLMASQDSDVGRRASGFLLPDQHGDLEGISQYTGKVLLVALWSPNDPDTPQLLKELNVVQSRYGKRGAQVVSICLSEDDSAASTFATGEHLNFPVVTDWGTSSVPEKLSMSPMASAYRTSTLPLLAITDRRRRVFIMLHGVGTYDGRSIDSALGRELALEPY